MKKRKVLFVAPFAHYDGHHCYVAFSESLALASSGVEVLLLTFNGFIDEELDEKKIKTLHVIPKDKRKIIERINSHELTKWPFMFVTSLLTLFSAINLYKRNKFDVIHLRDSDPFVFLPRVIGLFASHTRWVVSVLSTFERVPLIGPMLRLSRWRSIYSISNGNDNHYLYVTQNSDVRKYYSERFLGGILSGCVFELPPMIPNSDHIPNAIVPSEARSRLNLPENPNIFLSFGSVHPGKDPEVIFSAIQGIPNAFCIHAGKTTLNMVPRFEKLKTKYNHNVLINDSYVSESEKPYYFAASSAAILSYVRDFKATASMLWEACRYNTPVIASDVGQLGVLVQSYDLGLTFESQNPDSLQSAILDFMKTDAARKEEIRKNCKRFCDDYSGEKWAERCIDLYQKLD